MNRNLYNRCVILLLLAMGAGVGLISCKSIIEEDISEDKVIINTPISDELTSYTQLFWWEKLDGALSYQLQIAAPSFDSIQQLKLDTTVTTNKVYFTLASGKYEWRVRALNGSYETGYSGSKFQILDGNLNTMYVYLIKPASGSSTNSTVFTWNPIPIEGITYQIQVSQDATFNSSLIDYDTPSTSYPASLTTEGTYYWRVRAFKDQDTSLWATPNTFVYDVTAPDKVILSTPANNSTNAAVSGTLTWGDVSDATRYYVYVKYGSASEQKFTVSTESYSYSAAVNQTVNWRVEAVDAAGNTGLSSDTWKFTTSSIARKESEE